MYKAIERHLAEAKAALAALDDEKLAVVQAAAQMLIDCYRQGGAVYVCGNGGSAADAQHIAAELAGRFLKDRRALSCAALTVDTSMLTAVSNDYGFESVFSRQVEAYVRAGDVLWVLSTSGNSPNVLVAARVARAKGAKVLGFTGGTGGAMPSLCDICFIAPASTSYGTQHIHQLAYHAICETVEREVCL